MLWTTNKLTRDKTQSTQVENQDALGAIGRVDGGEVGGSIKIRQSLQNRLSPKSQNWLSPKSQIW